MRDMAREEELLRQAMKPTLDAMALLKARAPETLEKVFDALPELLVDPEYDPAEVAEASGWRDTEEMLSAFELAVGLPLAELVREARLETAARLLAETDLAVEVIAELTGYWDPRAFRRDFGAWSQDLSPKRFRRRARELAERAGAPPASFLGWCRWARMRRGELAGEEAEGLIEYLTRLYPAASATAPAAAACAGGQEEFLRRLAAELCGALDALPWQEQRDAVRRQIRFTAPAFFEYLSERGREVGGGNRVRAVQLAELAVLSLQAAEEELGAPDRRRLALAWTRLAHQRRLAGDLPGAEEALAFAADELAAAPPGDGDARYDGERLCLEATRRWSQGRFAAALELAGQAVAELRAADAPELLGRVLVLRAAVASSSPSPAPAADVLADLSEARQLLTPEKNARELLELHDLRLAAHARRGDAAAVVAALPAAREHAGKLEDAAALGRCAWFEGLALAIEGDAAAAERSWREALAAAAEPDAQGRPEQAAAVTLELLTLLWRQRRTAEALDQARALAAALERLEVHRDALPARRELCRAVDARRLTGELIDRLRRTVDAVVCDARARRGPPFEL